MMCAEQEAKMMSVHRAEKRRDVTLQLRKSTLLSLRPIPDGRRDVQVQQPHRPIHCHHHHHHHHNALHPKKRILPQTTHLSQTLNSIRNTPPSSLSPRNSVAPSLPCVHPSPPSAPATQPPTTPNSPTTPAHAPHSHPTKVRPARAFHKKSHRAYC